MNSLVLHKIKNYNQTLSKVTILGAPCVGKTAIAESWVEKKFNAEYIPTIGIDFLSKFIKISGRTVRIQLWDTSGQERFKPLIPGYISETKASVIVFDVTNRETFENCENWLEFIKEQENISLIVVVGNKIDCIGERNVTMEEGIIFATKIGAVYIETSAKKGANIEVLMEIIGNFIFS